MKFLIFFIFLAALWSVIESVVVECEFVDHGSSSLGYFCRVKNPELIISKDDREITGINVLGQHLNGKTDADVKGFAAHHMRVDFFPRGLKKFFKNIKTIQISSTTLQEITINDLKEFNHQLEGLHLDFNKITRIENGALRGLEKLETLSLYGNPCAYEYDYAQNDRGEVVKLIRRIETRCKGVKEL